MILQKFKVAGQHIERLNSLNLVADSRNFIGFQFEFSTEWQGVGKTAVITTGGADYLAIIESDGTVKSTNMPTLSQGTCLVSVFGGDLYTTDICKLEVRKSGFKNGTSPPTPPPDIYNQILSMVLDANTKAANAERLANDEQNAASLCAKKSASSAEAAKLFQVSAEKTVTGFDTHAILKINEYDQNAGNKIVEIGGYVTKAETSAKTATDAVASISGAIAAHESDINAHKSLFSALKTWAQELFQTGKAEQVQKLEAHEANLLTHQNIILDGNLN